MNEYRYYLQPYRGPGSRHTCPQCQRPKKYIRYLDRTNGEALPYAYGKCERLNNCGYHLNPYQDGYAKAIWKNENGQDWRAVVPPPTAKQQANQSKRSTVIPFEIFESSLKNYHNNRFAQYLQRLFGTEMTESLLRQFHIGTSKFWPGATVFWLIEENRTIVGGQIVLFDDNGHTQKKNYPDGSQQRCNSWVHTALKKSYQQANQPLPEWLADYIERSPKFPCLFGLPQLKADKTKRPIAIVEAAKTAVIASGYLPEFVWMAVGSLSYLNAARLSPLKGREVVLFPDRGGYERWRQKATELGSLAHFEVSDLLERKNAAPGSDLADYLVQSTPNKERSLPPGHHIEQWVRYDGEVITNIINEHGYPASWDE